MWTGNRRFLGRLTSAVLIGFLFVVPPLWAGEASLAGKKIDLIIPFGVGGGSDTAARAIVPSWEKALGATIVVTNMSGGGGTKGMLHVAQQPADGFTVLAVTTSHLIDAVDPKTRASLLNDFVPVARYQLDTSAVLVGSKQPFKTLKELIEFGKKSPRQLKFAGTSPGGWSEIQTLSVAKQAGIKITFVPFDSGAEIKAAALGGHIHGMIEEIAETLPLIQAGELRALAAVAEKRHPALPDVPSTVELGIQHSRGLIRGFAVRKGTPPALVALLAETLKKAMQDPGYKKFEKENHLDVREGYLPLDMFLKQWEDEVALYREVLKEAGLVR